MLIFIAGHDNHEVTVLAGSGEEGRVDGRADQCSFSWPQGMAIDESSQSCFVADKLLSLIRKITFSRID